MEKGVLVGSDRLREWLLPWWWENYRRENNLPVTFADFGMSASARIWCEARGTVIDIDPVPAAGKEEVPLSERKKWENSYSDGVWDARPAWFQKPLAVRQCSYEIGLWLDLDCEVLGSLLPLYEQDPSVDIALAREPERGQEALLVEGMRLPEEIVYNSGVIVFRKNSPIIERWAKESLLRSDAFVGDQNLLSRLIFLENYPVSELSPVYNWRMAYGLCVDPVIIHWVGWGKEYIKKYGGLRRVLEGATGPDTEHNGPVHRNEEPI